jgi:leucyl-tRNA synthetase
VTNPALLENDTIVLGVQVNGKLRGELTLPRNATQDQAVALAMDVPGVQTHVQNKTMRKVIFVQNRILNLVVS